MVVGVDMRAMNTSVIEQFRSGQPMRMPRDRMRLLTTIGRRSGREHTVPMMYISVGGRLLVVASNSGAKTDPGWLRNLVADPKVAVEVGGERYAALAQVLPNGERNAIWPQITAAIPMYEQHQSALERQIPVVAFIRA